MTADQEGYRRLRATEGRPHRQAARTARTATGSGAPVQQAAGERDPLLEAAAPAREGDVEGGELLLEPAGADAESQPAAARDVDRCGLLGEDDGLPQRQDENGCPDRGRIGRLRHECEGDQGVEVRRVRGPGGAPVGGKRVARLDRRREHDVVADPERLEPCELQLRGHHPDAEALGEWPAVRHFGADPHRHRLSALWARRPRQTRSCRMWPAVPVDSITLPFCASSVQKSGMRTRGRSAATTD